MTKSGHSDLAANLSRCHKGRANTRQIDRNEAAASDIAIRIFDGERFRYEDFRGGVLVVLAISGAQKGRQSLRGFGANFVEVFVE